MKLLKGLVKEIIGERACAYLGRMWLRIRLNSSYANIKDVIALKYYFIRSGNKTERILDRTKPHVLFVTEKWCDGDPNSGTTNTEHILFGSIEASGLATYDRIHQDEYQHVNKRPFDTALLLKCIKSKPDLVILTWPFTPTFETLKQIKERLKIPMVALWHDSVNHMEEAESFLPFVELNVPIDSTTAYLRITHRPEKYLPMWTPWDPRVYYNPNLSRDINVSFAGTMAGHPDRVAGISALRSNGIDVYQSGGQRESPLSVEEYARVHMRSRIALNFCYHPNGIAQLKGRVFEATLCGAMLLESENSETARWFEPMVDYVPFSGEKDLVEKVKYYLAHDAERMEIAACGHRKAREKYTGELFWKAILKKVLG